MSLSLLEQETIILFNERESDAQIYTYNEKLKTRFAEYAAQYPDRISENKTDTSGALHCRLPKKDLRVLFRKPRSEKQIRASQESGRKLQERASLPMTAGS